MAKDTTTRTDDLANPFGRIRPFAMEFGDNRNRNVMHPLFQEIFRGSILRVNRKIDEIDERTELIGDIPGQRLTVDPARRVVRVFDPLNTQEFAGLLDKVARMMQSESIRQLLPQRVTGRREIVQADLSDTQLRSHLWWAWRIVEGKLARVIEGDLPTLAEIDALPGKIRMNASEYAGSPKYREDLPPDQRAYKPAPAVTAGISW